MSRCVLLFGLVLFLSTSTASHAAAQREKFIIGFGIGPGFTSGDVDPNFGSKVGFATDFKIGAMLGESVQLYYTSKASFHSADGALTATNVAGPGVTYEMASGFNVNGMAGLAAWTDFDWDTEVGFGLGAGVGYEFADLWILNLGGTWGRISDTDVISIAATISILSH
jgi:opacity protein-like surface antigen